MSAEDSLRVARWSLYARAPIPNPVLIDAARAANVSGDPDLGAQLAALAVRAGAAGAAALLLARSHQIRKRFADAESVLARLEGDIESPDTAIAYLEQRVAVLYWGLRRPDDARALLARAQEWWVDRSWLRRLAPVRLQLAALLDGQAGAAAVAGEILADDSLQEGVRRQLEPVYAASLFYSGRVFEAYEVARRIRPAFPLSNHTEELALIAFSMISFESGQDLRGLEREMAEIFEEGVRIGDDAAAGVAAAALSGIAFLAGRYRDAKRWLGEAELHRERHDTFGALLITWATRVGVAHFSGDDDGAAVALARCEDALQGRDPLPNQLRYIVCARAWAADADGDRAAAQRLLLDGADSVAARPLYAALLRYEAMRCGTPPDEVAASLVRLGERCDARLVMAYAGHAVALASHDGAGLLEAANEFERIGALRYATEAAAHATQAFLAAGEEESARRAFARSSELFADGQDGIMPVIEGLDRAAVGLTAREGQLVELARQGLTNVAIAERLVLSVRTVESHLYRAMHKLGVSDRRQL